MSKGQDLPASKAYGVAESWTLSRYWNLGFVCLLTFTLSWFGVGNMQKYGSSPFGFTVCLINFARTLALPPFVFSKKMDICFNMLSLIAGPLLGAYFSTGLIYYLKNRNIAYWVLITVFGIICLVQDFGIRSSIHPNRCYAVRVPTTVDDFTFGTFLSAFIGCAMFHWSAKLGFVICFQTVNMIKVSEASCRSVLQLPQQEKDIQLISLVIATFFFGVIVAQAITYSSPTACYYPNAVLVGLLPLHYYMTGLHQYLYAVYLERENKRLDKKRHSRTVGSSVSSVTFNIFDPAEEAVNCGSVGSGKSRGVWVSSSPTSLLQHVQVPEEALLAAMQRMQDGGKDGVEMGDICGGKAGWHSNEMHTHSNIDSTPSPLHLGGRHLSRRLTKLEMIDSLDNGNLIIRRGPGWGIQDVDGGGDQEFFNRDAMVSHVVNYNHRDNSLLPRASVINLTPFVGD